MLRKGIILDWLLPRRNIVALVQNVTPFLFKSDFDTKRKMSFFLASSVVESSEAETVDLMKYILSYASDPTICPETNYIYSREATESSVRYLLGKMAYLCFRVPVSDMTAPEHLGPKIEMKRGDWICPKCKFMNFARNTKCIECEELRPKRQLTGGEWDCPECDCERSVEASFSSTASRLSLGYASRDYANSTTADNKVSQLNPSSDSNNMVADEDFPKIMPFGKGANRFVVSTRKTPLERRLTNSQYQNDLGNNGNAKGSNSNYVPFVPLPDDMFAKKPQNLTSEDCEATSVVKEDFQSFEKPAAQEDNRQIKEKDQEQKSERWFKKVEELHNVKDLASAIADEDFPQIMPMRKGENRFVVSKKKDRSLTSPAYKRQKAMEQGSSTNFVPFVPFPPDYFAKKYNQQPNSTDSTPKPTDKVETSSSPVNCVQGTENQQTRTDNLNSISSVDYSGPISESTTSKSFSPQNSRRNSLNTNSGKETSNFVENSQKTPENQNVTGGWTGKSLEGSAVKEPDPLDMSEEGKAERWFRRVAQIKDISELSQIPDEDFPSIMPMRKGVNRFVVSKRKTPLERRLTSPQYRKNLPIVSSDPAKKESDSS